MAAGDCKLCRVSTERITGENEHCLAFVDKHPVADYHTLIIPKRHAATFFDLTSEEHLAAIELLNQQKLRIEELDDTVLGFNVGTNAGDAAGQSIFHCHIHLIPRRKGDADPIHGVRNVIPENAAY